MSVSSYFQQLLAAVSRLEDYGLVNTITSNSETRPSSEIEDKISNTSVALISSRSRIVLMSLRYGAIYN